MLVSSTSGNPTCTTCILCARPECTNACVASLQTEHIVFCKPSTLQKELYRAFLDDKAVKKTLASETFDQSRLRWAQSLCDLTRPSAGADAHSGEGSSLGTQVLGLITKLSKILNHPDLVIGKKDGCEEEESVPDLEGPRVDDIFPVGYMAGDAGQSGKMQFVFAVLKEAKICGDRVVVVSNYTTTLGLLETICKGLQYPYIRLDGSTDVSKRGDLVKQFNDPRSDVMVFLLSSKAGGVGLNLIGGNRIILLDPAWNPATDLQAMARVWRFGQKKEVFIYRTLTSGTIEERVFQKQVWLSVTHETRNINSNISDQNAHKSLQFLLHRLQAYGVLPTGKSTLSLSPQLKNPRVLRQCQRGIPSC